MVKCAAGGGIGTEGRQFPSPISFDEETLLSWADSYFRPWLQGLFLFPVLAIKVKLDASHAFLPIIRSKQTRRRDNRAACVSLRRVFKVRLPGRDLRCSRGWSQPTPGFTGILFKSYHDGSEFFRRIGSSRAKGTRRVIASGGLMRELLLLAEIATLMEPVKVDEVRFRTAFVLILVLAISGLFLAVAWPFLQALLVGAMLAGLCQPTLQMVGALASRSQVACFRGARS